MRVVGLASVSRGVEGVATRRVLGVKVDVDHPVAKQEVVVPRVRPGERRGRSEEVGAELAPQIVQGTAELGARLGAPRVQVPQVELIELHRRVGRRRVLVHAGALREPQPALPHLIANCLGDLGAMLQTRQGLGELAE